MKTLTFEFEETSYSVQYEIQISNDQHVVSVYPKGKAFQSMIGSAFNIIIGSKTGITFFDTIDGSRERRIKHEIGRILASELFE